MSQRKLQPVTSSKLLTQAGTATAQSAKAVISADSAHPALDSVPSLRALEIDRLFAKEPGELVGVDLGGNAVSEEIKASDDAAHAHDLTRVRVENRPVRRWARSGAWFAAGFLVLLGVMLTALIEPASWRSEVEAVNAPPALPKTAASERNLDASTNGLSDSKTDSAVLIDQQAARPTESDGSLSPQAAVSAAAPGALVRGVPYDEQRLGFALAWATQHAEQCHRSGRAVGTARLTLTFAPTGRVSEFAMRGEPISSAPVAVCIASYFRSMRIPEFEGAPFTIDRELTLH
jgi:hypothetical protein